jgi:hypothetical protein
MKSLKPKFTVIFPVAGMEYAIPQKRLAKKVFKKLKLGDALKVKHEKKNKFDAYACAIYFKNQKLGYIPKQYNKKIIKMFQTGHRFMFFICKTPSYQEYFEFYQRPAD